MPPGQTTGMLVPWPLPWKFWFCQSAKMPHFSQEVQVGPTSLSQNNPHYCFLSSLRRFNWTLRTEVNVGIFVSALNEFIILIPQKIIYTLPWMNIRADTGRLKGDHRIFMSCFCEGLWEVLCYEGQAGSVAAPAKLESDRSRVLCIKH